MDAEPPSLSLREIAAKRGLLEHVARRVTRGGFADELPDVVSEAAIELLERHARRPEIRVRRPWRAARFAVLEAISRRSRRHVQTVELVYDWQAAVASDRARLERLQSRLEIETAEDLAVEQIQEWRGLSGLERARRRAEADAALGSSPSGLL